MRHDEHYLQAACVRWFQYKYPTKVIFAIPNGAHLAGRNAIERARKWKRLKAEGAREGTADLFIAVHTKEYAGLFIEMKVKQRQSAAQKEFEKDVTKAGYMYVICRTFETFEQIVNDYIAASRI
jgi:acetoin utilization deacetylase AcuC-like enzyme